MPWTVDDPPSVAKNWTLSEKRKCVAAANAALRDGGSDEEAIFACIAAAGRSKKEMETDKMGFLERVMEFVRGGSIEVESKDQNFKTEGGVRYKRTDYAVHGEADKPTTWKLRLAEGSSGNFTVAQVARAITALQPGGFRGQRVQLGSGEKTEAVRNISAVIAKVGDVEQKETLRERLAKAKELGFGIKVIEGKDGQTFWMTRTTNAFEDREEEMFTTKSLEEYVAQVDKGIPIEIKELLEKMGLPATDQGELWFWHIPGSRIGEPRWKGVEGRFLVEVGVFDDTPEGKAAATHFKEHGDDYRTSHGYLYHPVDRAQREYAWLWKFETSPLPAGAESNPWTGIDVITKEVKMISEVKKAELVKIFGQELADGILAKATEDSKALEEMGITFKEQEKETEDKQDEEPQETLILEKDSKAMEMLAEAVAEKIGMKDVNANLEKFIKMIEEAGKRIEAIEKADKPFVVLSRGFRASQEATTEVEGKDIPEGALQSAHILDNKLGNER